MKVPLMEIIKLVNEYYDTDITIESRIREVAQPRYVYMYLASWYHIDRVKCYSNSTIARSVGLKQNGSVLSATVKINDWMEYDKALKNEIEYLKNKIKDLQTLVY